MGVLAVEESSRHRPTFGYCPSCPEGDRTVSLSPDRTPPPGRVIQTVKLPDGDFLVMLCRHHR